MAKKRSTHISTLGSQLTSIVSVALVLFILGLVAMGALAGRGLSDDIRSNVGFIVKTAHDTPERDINGLKKLLNSSPWVSSYVYTSADEILTQESEYIGEDIASLLDQNPYVAEFDVKVRPEYANSDSITALAARFGHMPAVGEVITETSVVDSVDSALRRVSLVLLGVAAALLAISFVLINNTVSLSIYSRRFVIHTMRLVGATPGFIRRPFVAAGMVSGIVAAIIAAGACIGMRYYAETVDPLLADTIAWPMMAAVGAALLLCGITICGTAAFVATTRYLRRSYDDMYMK